MHQTHFWNLMAKHLSGNASGEEASELEALMKVHPELSFAAQQVTDLWKLKGGYDMAEAEEAFKRHIQLIQKDQPGAVDMPRRFRRKKINRGSTRVALYGVIVLFLLAGGWLLWHSGKTTAEPFAGQKAEVWTRPGSRTRLVLPDSTVVWLNGDSKLTYDRDFGSGNRNTILAGEAFFDVKKSSLPFIIQTQNVRIKVVGTAFNVKCYPNEKTTETSVVRGRVEISMNQRPGAPFVVKPNQKLVVANEEAEQNEDGGRKQPLVVLKELTHVTDSTVLETSWVENKLVFVDESFEHIARKMERWYGTTIVFKNEKIKGERLTGMFEKETVRQALEALKITVPFRFTIKDEQLIIIY